MCGDGVGVFTNRVLKIGNRKRNNFVYCRYKSKRGGGVLFANLFSKLSLTLPFSLGRGYHSTFLEAGSGA